MDTWTTRLAIYGAAIATVASLVWAGFFYRVDADVMTLIGSAEMHLRMAATMPLVDQHGKAVQVRADLLQQAGQQLDKVDLIESDYAPATELRAYGHFLAGRYVDAARTYESAQRMRECPPTMRAALAINEARMWRAALRPKDALLALERHGAFGGEQQSAAQVERLLTCEELADHPAAQQLAREIAFADRQQPAARIAAGEMLERARCLDEAERAYTLARQESGIAAYYLARLKLAAGDTDTCCGLLEEAVKADARQVKTLVHEDERFWLQLADQPRLQRILGASTTASPQGR